MALEELNGALVTLKRLPPSNTLAEQFKNKDLRGAAGMFKIPDLDYLKHLIDEDQSLVIMDVLPEGSGKSVGLAGVVFYDGPPYLFAHFYDGAVDLDIIQDAFLQLIPAFFENTEEPALFVFLPRPVDDAFHTALTDGGFDPFDDCPTIDNNAEAAYVLERYTYEAYYGDDLDDEE